MNAKLFTFVTGSAVGIIVGIAVGLMISSSADIDPDKDKVVDKSQPPRLSAADPQKKIADLEKEIAELKEAKEVAPVEIASADDESGKAKGPVMKIFGAGGDSEINMAEMRKHLEKAEGERAAKNVTAKLASLTRALNLTDEQAAKVRSLLEKREAEKGDMMSGLLGLASGAIAGEIVDVEIPDVSEGGGEDAFDFDSELLALLDDDQAGAYEEYQSARRENRIEVEAGQQLASLQSAIPDLTADQKDQAFAEFARLSRENVEQNGTDDGGALNFRRMAEQRQEQMAAMEIILTRDQMELYRTNNSSRAITIGGDPGAASIITSEISIGVDGGVIPASSGESESSGDE